jgi:hypothetical protein
MIVSINSSRAHGLLLSSIFFFGVVSVISYCAPFVFRSDELITKSPSHLSYLYTVCCGKRPARAVVSYKKGGGEA